MENGQHFKTISLYFVSFMVLRLDLSWKQVRLSFIFLTLFLQEKTFSWFLLFF